MAISSFSKKFIVTEEFADKLADTLNRKSIKTDKNIENFKSTLTTVQDCPELLKVLCPEWHNYKNDEKTPYFYGVFR